MGKTRISLGELANMDDDEVQADLLELAVELSEAALNAGKPKASALITLAASNLRSGNNAA
jgi:hypothetical protein